MQVRQVVVHGDWRGKGAGRLLMDEAEKRLSELGFTRFVLYAREESASFYERCGYQRTGEALELIGFKHWRMEKQSYC